MFLKVHSIVAFSMPGHCDSAASSVAVATQTLRQLPVSGPTRCRWKKNSLKSNFHFKLNYKYILDEYI